MVAKQTIAIIGANSRNGKTAAKKLAEKRSRILLADENQEELIAFKDELSRFNPLAEIEVMECMKEAGWEADIVILALNWQAEKDIFTLVKPFITGKTVISFSKDNNCLLPYSKVIPLRETDAAWPAEMIQKINETDN